MKKFVVVLLTVLVATAFSFGYCEIPWIKPVAEPGADGWDKYVKEVTLLHKMLVQPMKCKQTTNLEHGERLRSLLDRFETSYFETADSANESETGREHAHPHPHEH